MSTTQFFPTYITLKPGFQRRLELTADTPLAGPPKWRIVGGKGKLKVAKDGMSAILTEAERCRITVTADTKLWLEKEQ